MKRRLNGRCPDTGVVVVMLGGMAADMAAGTTRPQSVYARVTRFGLKRSSLSKRREDEIRRRVASYLVSERKHKLRCTVPQQGKRLLYCDHVEGQNERLFQLARKRDLEGIVAKRKFDPYLPDNAKWYKIRNRKYSQWVGRERLFERERASDPDWHLWNACALAADQIAKAVV